MVLADCTTVALIVLLAMGPTPAVRQSGGTEKPPNTSKSVMTGSGWLCEDMSQLKKETDPVEVQQYLLSFDLYTNYKTLKDALINAPKNRVKTWKGSALSREIFLGNHSNVFRAKNLEVFLAKKKKSFIKNLVKSSFMLCFAESHARHPEDILTMYSDGFSVKAGCYGKEKTMPPGVAAQTFDHDIVKADPNTMPVEVLKLLSAKDVMDLHRQFAKEINTAKDQKDRKSNLEAVTDFLLPKISDKSNWAALITLKYQEDFQARGLGVYFNWVRVWCPCGKYGDRCPITFRWFEYADLDIVNPAYTPNADTRYPISKLWKFLQCNLPAAVPWEIVAKVRQEKMSFGNCSEVDRAVPRQKTENACKCPYKSNVFCNGVQVAGRKFALDDIFKQPECNKFADMYCAPKHCKHNMYRDSGSGVGAAMAAERARAGNRG